MLFNQVRWELEVDSEFSIFPRVLPLTSKQIVIIANNRVCILLCSFFGDRLSCTHVEIIVHDTKTRMSETNTEHFFVSLTNATTPPPLTSDIYLKVSFEFQNYWKAFSFLYLNFEFSNRPTSNVGAAYIHAHNNVMIFEWILALSSPLDLNMTQRAMRFSVTRSEYEKFEETKYELRAKHRVKSRVYMGKCTLCIAAI